MTDARFRTESIIWLAVIALALVAPAAPAQPVLLVCDGGNHTVGAYNAINGATINAAFIGASQLSLAPIFLARDSNNHLFVSTFSSVTALGEYDATTGATINANFIVGPPVSNHVPVQVNANNHILYPSTSSPADLGEYDGTTGDLINGSFIPPAGAGFRDSALDNHNHIFVNQGFSIGEFDATTGAAINGTLVNLPSGSNRGIAVDAFDHLFVVHGNQGGNDTVGEYDAVTGATINSSFISGLSAPECLALDGNNHLFVSDAGTHTIGEYDATTGATVNASFVSGLSVPTGMLIIPAPEPSSLLLVALAGIGFGLRRCRSLAQKDGIPAA